MSSHSGRSLAKCSAIGAEAGRTPRAGTKAELFRASGVAACGSGPDGRRPSGITNTALLRADHGGKRSHRETCGDLRAVFKLLVALLASCAHQPAAVETISPELDARVYEMDLERTKAAVAEALAAGGIMLLATEDPLVLRSKPVASEASPQGQSPVGSPDTTWVVLFERRGPNATAVRVFADRAFAWAEGTERTRLAEPPPPGGHRLPPRSVRNRVVEAAVAAQLDAQVGAAVARESQTLGGTPGRAMPLEDPPPAEAVRARAKHPAALELGDLGAAFAPGHMILLTDPLGATEPWGHLESLADHAATRGIPLTVALQLPSAEQAALNAFLASPPTAAERARYVNSAFWSRDWQDGRTSVAVLNFLERIRHRRAAGQAVTILAIDSNRLGNPRHAHAASELLRHRLSRPERLIIAVLGNVMVTLKKGAEWDQSLLPVGARLAAVLPGKTHAFDIAFHRGTQWTCRLRSRGKLECGTWRAEPGPRQRANPNLRQPYFQRFPQVSADGFDGIFFVGDLASSLPANDRVRRDDGNASALRMFPHSATSVHPPLF